MNYLSVCSGIEAASVAWNPLGWKPIGFSDIEKFPSAVLKHHYPEVENYGDMQQFREWGIPAESVELLVGGTPCQSFSVAGLRRGLRDPRGNLALVFLAMAEAYQPRWLVWENVRGVLSDQTNAFGNLVGGLSELGYDCAWRVLDAQYFGVPQRRKRVFLVGHPRGGGIHPGQVLFEPESLCRDLAPRREAREGIAPALAKSVRTGSGGIDREDMHTLIPSRETFGGGSSKAIDVSTAINAHPGASNRCDFESETFVSTVSENYKVRRLTPRECERLQGFPDDYTLIKYGRGMSKDGPRTKALGNSMAVPVMRWIGERIALLDG